jgi:hypothetical protein
VAIKLPQRNVEPWCPRFAPVVFGRLTWVTAVLSGQYALEQTFIIPVESLVSPEQSPLRVLEAIVGKRMA